MTPNAPAPANKALDATKAGLGVRPQPTGGVGPNAFVQLRARADCLSKVDWTPAEQSTLDQALTTFPADKYPPLERYVRVAAGLANKGVRDVALRVRWMNENAAGKKRKLEQDASSKKRRERGQSIFAIQPKPPAGQPMQQPMQHAAAFAQPQPVLQLDDHGGQTVGGVAGPLAALLEQNYAILNSFKQNMAQYKVNENTDLLVRFRDNILTILNQMNSMQGVMSQMPPLPVRLNVELANNFLPKQPTGMYPGGIPGMPPPIGPLGGMPMNGFMMGPMSSMPSGSIPLGSMPVSGMQGSMPMSNSPIISMPTPSEVAASLPSTSAPALPPPSAPAPSSGTALAPLVDRQAAAVSAAGPSTSQPPGMHWPIPTIQIDKPAAVPAATQPATQSATQAATPFMSAAAAPKPAAPHSTSLSVGAGTAAPAPPAPQPRAAVPPGQPVWPIIPSAPAHRPAASQSGAAAPGQQPAAALVKQEPGAASTPTGQQNPGNVPQHPQPSMPQPAAGVHHPPATNGAATAVAQVTPEPVPVQAGVTAAAKPQLQQPAVKAELSPANGKTVSSGADPARMAAPVPTRTPAPAASPVSQGMTTRRGLKAKSPTGPSRPAAATPAKLKAEPQAVKPQ